MDPAATGSEPTSTPIKSVKLQTNDDIALSGDLAGVVRSWDILTGLCKATFHTPAKNLSWGDMQLVNNQLILVWCPDRYLHIWSTEKGGSPQVVDAPWESWTMRPKISGDGSKVFFLTCGSL